MKLTAIENEMVNAMARAMYVLAYADKQEELAMAGKRSKSPDPGGDWMEFAPPTPRWVRDRALMFAGVLPDLYVVLHHAAKADVLKNEEKNEESLTGEEVYERIDELTASTNRRGMSYAAELGHCLAMQAMGTGVSWFDDHARFDIQIPHLEFYLP